VTVVWKEKGRFAIEEAPMSVSGGDEILVKIIKGVIQP
jgi:hypothetical protein